MRGLEKTWGVVYIRGERGESERGYGVSVGRANGAPSHATRLRSAVRSGENHGRAGRFATPASGATPAPDYQRGGGAPDATDRAA